MRRCPAAPPHALTLPPPACSDRDVLALTDATCFRLSCEAFVDVMAPLQDVLAYGFTQRVLSGMPLFQHLSLAELTKVTEHMTVREYSDGEFIIMCAPPALSPPSSMQAAPHLARRARDAQARRARVQVFHREGGPRASCAAHGAGGLGRAGGRGDWRHAAWRLLRCVRRAPRRSGRGVCFAPAHAGRAGEGGILGDENYERNASCIASGPRTVCATMAREAFSECMVSMRDALASLYMVRTKLWQAPDQEEATIRATDLEVIRRLGRGNFGSVNIVRHKVRGQRVCAHRPWHRYHQLP